MGETTATWLPWRAPHVFENGVETAFHHPRIEFRRRGDGASRCVDPLDLLAEPDLAGATWRPMLWAREGAANRRMREAQTAENIACGEDGYLFHRFGSVFEQIYEGAGLTDAGARQWVEELARRQAWCAARGAEYRWLVVPETHSVCPDKIPGSPALSPNRPIMRILRAADPGVRAGIVYPLAEMVAGRTRHATNARDDMHFTPFGAFLCYRALMATLPGCAPERTLQESELQAQEGAVLGGFGETLGLARTHGTRMVPPRPPHRRLLDDPRIGRGRVEVLETDASHLPTMVTFRTSNTALLLPCYLRHFSRIVSVEGRSLLQDLIESEQPQAVVEETPERFLAAYCTRPGHDPDKAFVVTQDPGFAAFTGFALPLPRTRPPAAFD